MLKKKTANTRALLTFLKNSHWALILFCLLCSAYGCLLVYSVAMTDESGMRGVAVQIGASFGGLLLAVLISRIDYMNLCKLWPVWLGLAGILVLLTFTPLGLRVAGTDDTAWLGFPTPDNPLITFQPSELLKIAFIISFSVHLNKVRDSINRPLTLLLLCAHGGAAAGSVFLQGDDGTALVFVCIFVCMLFAAGLHPGYLIAAGGAAICAVPVLLSVLDETKLARIWAIIRVDDYLQSEGWQQATGLSAMGTGQLWGVGFLEGGDHGLFARNNDFIFTVAGEEFGFVGSLLLLVLLIGLLGSILYTACKTQNFTGRLLCVGMLALIGFQSVINLGMVVRLLPVIGITLPFFSAGGSSAATLYLGIGLVLSVHYHSKLRSRGGLSFLSPEN